MADFPRTLERFAAAVEANDGAGLAALFTEDGVYEDGFFGAYTGPAAIAEMQESVELARTSLTETRKDPRRSPKWFKKAEIETRDLLRKIESFEQEMGFAERPMLEKAADRIDALRAEAERAYQFV